MNKAELVAAIARGSGLTKKDSALALDAALSAISAALSQGEKVQLVGFGAAEMADRAQRTARNPKNGAPAVITADRVPVFKAGKGLKDSVSL